MLEAAIRYAHQGFHVFPVTPGAKYPPLTRHGHKDATIDPEQIREWWTKWPDANIGCHPGASNHVVIDPDPGHDPSIIAKLPPTLTVKTPRGHHLWFHSTEVLGNQKLAPHIDIRSADGYALLPPSTIVGSGEYHGDMSGWAEELPTWVAEQQRKENPPARKAPEGMVLDTEERISQAYALARIAHPAENGKDSQRQTMALVNKLLDLVSHEVALDALITGWMPRCIGEWTAEWVSDRVYSTKPGTGRRNDIGCGPERLSDEYPKTQPATGESRAKYAGLWPDEFAGLPDPIYWDETKMIPRVDGEGASVLVYGQYGSHKTNVILTWIMDMIEKGARVCYTAGEGARGIGKARIPAHCTSRNIELITLRNKLRIVPAIPLLQNTADVEAFIEAQREFAPNVVILDTLATATAGLDENSSLFASLLTDNGSVGRIKKAFKATVIVVAHEGKDSARGARGHSGLSGNVDAGLRIVTEDQRIDVFVDKMRDGEGKFHTYYAVEPGQVPVPKRISEEQYKGMSPKAEREGDLLDEVATALKVLGAHKGGNNEWRPATNEGGIEVGQLADTILQTRGEVPEKHTTERMRKRLEALAERNPVYRVGKGARGHWRWAIFIDEV